MRDKASELRSQNNSLKQQVENLRSQENSLSAFYEGEAREKFKAAVQQDLNKMEQFMTTITEYIAALEKAAAEYDKAEAKASQVAGQRNA